MDQSQPRTQYRSNRLLLRIAVVLLFLAGAILALQFLLRVRQDPDILPGVSTGMIAALEYVDDGARVVIFDEKGTKTELPGWTAGVTDEAPVWRPDGQRLFFTSDRDEKTFQIFRWRPGGGEPEIRSVGSRSKGTPRFDPDPNAFANESALITSGGFVLEFNPRDGSTRQVLPPPTGAGDLGQTEEGGSGDQFGMFYSRIGESFIDARFAQDRRFVVGTMRRENGTVLVVQDFEPDAQGNLKPPSAVFAGENVWFDVSSQGWVVATIHFFQFVDPDNIPEEFIVDNRPKAPFKHGLILFNPAEADSLRLVFATEDREQIPGTPVFSPDGSRVAIPVGKMGEDDQWTPSDLAVFGTVSNPPVVTRLVRDATVRDVSWMPDGANVLFVKEIEGRGTIQKINLDSGNVSPLTQAAGDFGFPIASPQVARP